MPKYSKDQMRTMQSNGYTYAGFWKGLYHFTKKEVKGWLEVKCNNSDIKTNNIQYMLQNNLTRN